MSTYGPYASRGVVSGVRGRHEDYLRTIRGTIDTGPPSITAGIGFTISKNGTGDITITFVPAFAGAPSITHGAEAAVGAGNFLGTELKSGTTATSTRIVVKLVNPGAGSVTLTDALFSFTAIGPI